MNWLNLIVPLTATTFTNFSPRCVYWLFRVNGTAKILLRSMYDAAECHLAAWMTLQSLHSAVWMTPQIFFVNLNEFLLCGIHDTGEFSLHGIMTPWRVTPRHAWHRGFSLKQEYLDENKTYYKTILARFSGAQLCLILMQKMEVKNLLTLSL
jgi:hypothetical protein